jgi:hypothetical protein
VSVEASRRHGPFDSRYPLIRHKPSPRSLRARGEDRTDFAGFLARFYPHSRRHDFDVLAAYVSYATDVAAPDLLGSAPGEETARWEGEGGAVALRDLVGGATNISRGPAARPLSRSQSERNVQSLDGFNCQN